MLNQRKRVSSSRFSRERLIEIYGNGKTPLARLGKENNICNKELKRLLIEEGLILFEPEKQYPALTKELLESEYINLDIKDLAKKYNISQSTVNILFDHYKILRKHIIYSVNEDFFNRDAKEVFYTAGLYAADGCVSKRGGIQIGLKAEDKKLLEDIKSLMNFSGNLYFSNKEHPSYSLEIGSVKMVESLTRFGIGQRKSLTYEMPEWLVNHDLVNYFLLGYFDGDGGFHLRGKCDAGIGFRGTVNHLHQINNILVKKGICKDFKKIIKISDGIGCLKYGGITLCKKIYEFFHQNSIIHLERKYQQYLIIKSNYDRIANKREEARIRNDGILIDHNAGMKADQLSTKYKMHPTSISNLIRKLKQPLV